MIDTPPNASPPCDATAITRPDPSLLRYYLIVSILTGPCFPFVYIPLHIKYKTLRYKIDARDIRDQITTRVHQSTTTGLGDEPHPATRMLLD